MNTPPTKREEEIFAAAALPEAERAAYLDAARGSTKLLDIMFDEQIKRLKPEDAGYTHRPLQAAPAIWRQPRHRVDGGQGGVGTTARRTEGDRETKLKL